MDVTIIGHGSLMSGVGLSLSGMLRVLRARIIALTQCRRGFAKLSRYGDRFATDLEIAQCPLLGRQVAPSSIPTDEEVEGLALTVPLEDAFLLSKREGYDPEALQRLAKAAQADSLSLADFLWGLHTAADHDMVTYRRRLFALTGFTSPHYIPHPVCLNNNEYALIFLAPGFEGTGAEDIISIRQQTGVRDIMSAAEVWRRKQNEDQLSYCLSCLLGGVHGVSVRDLLATVDEEPIFAEKLRKGLQPLLATERTSFCAATGLSSEAYRNAFGEPEGALARSGLKDFLSGVRV